MCSEASLLRNRLTSLDGNLREIVATDELSVPTDVTTSAVSELVSQALEQRPDIWQAKLQVSNGDRAVAGSPNARLPEIDLYGAFQSRVFSARA